MGTFTGGLARLCARQVGPARPAATAHGLIAKPRSRAVLIEDATERL